MALIFLYLIIILFLMASKFQIFLLIVLFLLLVVYGDIIDYWEVSDGDLYILQALSFASYLNCFQNYSLYFCFKTLCFYFLLNFHNDLELLVIMLVKLFYFQMEIMRIILKLFRHLNFIKDSSMDLISVSENFKKTNSCILKMKKISKLCVFGRH